MVCRDTNGTLLGFLGSVDHPASQMIGPGVAESEKVALSMLKPPRQVSREMSGFPASRNRKRGGANRLFLGCKKLRDPFFPVQGRNPTTQRGCYANLHA